MASYRVAVSASAEKELSALPARMIARIVPRLELLAVTPGLPDVRNCKAVKRNGGFVWETTESYTSLTIAFGLWM